MSATICSCVSKTPGMSGLLISLAVVFAGNAAIAEGLTGLVGSERVSSSMFGSYTAADLEQLDHISATSATSARLSALGVKTSMATGAARSAVEQLAAVAQIDDTDLFPHSARVLPMLVARPETETFLARTAIAPRPGLGQPVGVSRASVRPRSPAERTAR